MSEYDRGVFEPADRIRVFDGSEDDDDTEGSRLPVLIVIALVVLVSFAGVVWLAYEKGVASGRNEPRIAAVDSNGEPTTQYKGLKIYEQPAPNDADVITAAPASSAPPKTNDAVQQQPAPSASQPDSRAPAASANPTIPPAPSHPNTGKPTSVAALPKTTATSPPQASSAPPQASSAPQEATETAPAADSGYVLQIGSYKSEQEAADAWSAAKAAHAAILEGLSPNVKKVDLGDKGVWFRLRVAPFADKAAANGLCDRLKTDGGACLLAR